MDGKQTIQGYENPGKFTERSRQQQCDRRRETTCGFRGAESPVDPVNSNTLDNCNIFHPPRLQGREKCIRLQPEQLTLQEQAQLLEKSGLMQRQMQQSVQLLQQKKQMQQQQQLLLQQQQQIQQQQIQSQLLLQQQQQKLQKRLYRQESPQWQKRDVNREPPAEVKNAEQSLEGGRSNGVSFAESFDNLTVQDLFAQCQNHLNVINACTDLQQTIKDEMKKQAKLDSVVCQKLAAKAQRLQLQATSLERVHAPNWVATALNELAAHVSQQAQVHHAYTTTLIEQTVAIQHSLDGHHELMKSVLAQNDTKQNTLPGVEDRKGLARSGKPEQNTPGTESRSMTFLQASNIFEGIRKPRMKLISSLEYQQEQFNTTKAQLNQVICDIESLSKTEDNEALLWREQLQKKDLEIRKEFLETRMDQLESDLKFVMMDLNEFEHSNKDNMLEVLNVFRQHRIRYDTTLKQSFQLLKAASLRDITFLHRLARKKDLDTVFEQESDDVMDGIASSARDPWGCLKTIGAIPDDSPPRDSMEFNEEIAAIPQLWQTSDSSQAIRTMIPQDVKIHNQQARELKVVPVFDPKYSLKLSSDSEISSLSKTELYRNSLLSVETKRNRKIPIGPLDTEGLQEMSDFNFSRVEATPSTTEVDDIVLIQQGVSVPCKVGQQGVSVPCKVRQQVVSVPCKVANLPARNIKHVAQVYKSDDEEEQFIIARYVEDNSLYKPQSRPSEKGDVHDIMIISRGAQSRPSLGNFENNVISDFNVQSLYKKAPTLIENPYKKEEKRVANLIDKYASGSCINRASLEKNWNSCRPLVLDSTSNDNFSDSISHAITCATNRPELCIHDNQDNFVQTSESSLELNKTENTNNSEATAESSEKNAIADQELKEEHNVSSCELYVQDDVSSCNCKPLPDQSVNKDFDAYEELLHDTIDNKTDYVQTVMGHNSDEISDYHETFQDAGQKMGTSDILGDRLSSKIIDSCDLTQMHEGKNLNSCEALKSHSTDMEKTEGENHIELDSMQVFFPENQPRNIRVCTVRPISSEFESGGVERIGTEMPKGDVHISTTDTNISRKYENLRIYEATAGQFTVPCELKHGDMSNAATINNSNNKADFSGPGCQSLSVADSLKSPACASVYGYHKKCTLNDIADTNVTSHAASRCCTTPTTFGTSETTKQLKLSENVTPSDPRNQSKNNIMFSGIQKKEVTQALHERVCNHTENSSVEDALESLSDCQHERTYNSYSKFEQSSRNFLHKQNVSPVSYKNNELAYDSQNHFRDNVSDALDDDETIPKTLYSLFEQSRVNESIASVADGYDVQERHYKSPSSYNLKNKHTGDPIKAVTEAAKYARSNNEVCSEFGFPANSYGTCTIYPNSGSNVTLRNTSGENDTVNRKISEQTSSEISKSDQTNEYIFESRRQPSQSCQGECCTGHSFQSEEGSTQEETGNTQAETFTRPHKSSLKKARVAFSFNDEKNESESTPFQNQCLRVEIAEHNIADFRIQTMRSELETKDETLQLPDTCKMQKCLKQVRFDSTVQYYDNVDIDADDIIALGEHGD